MPLREQRLIWAPAPPAPLSLVVEGPGVALQPAYGEVQTMEAGTVAVASLKGPDKPGLTQVLVPQP